MKGDFSRFGRRSGPRYSSVLMQQGRVLLDSDWNEQIEIQSQRDKVQATDVIGCCGVPRYGAGFEVTPLNENGQSKDLRISPGRIYVHGVLAEMTDGAAIDAVVAFVPGSPAATGQWQSVRNGHELVPMPDGKVLDWVPADGTWRLLKYAPTNTQDILPDPSVAKGQWQSVRNGHRLIPMPDGKVLDWVPADGTWRLWKYDPTNAQDILPGPPLAAGQWASMDKSMGNGHELILMPGGKVLDWVPADGMWRLYQYDPSSTADVLPGPPVVRGQWDAIRTGHKLFPMADGRVLDWTPQDGRWWLRNTKVGVVVNETPDGQPLENDQWVEVMEPNPSPNTSPRYYRVALPATAIDDFPRAIELVGYDYGAASGRFSFRRIVTFRTQPDYPTPDPDLATLAGKHLIYVDVWERHVTALEDPDIREVALGGADTTTRVIPVAQVKLLATAGHPLLDCRALGRCWSPLPPHREPRLRARAATPTKAPANPCEIPASAGYRRLENQLYRVEIQSVDSNGKAAFMWSRDNGSVTYQVSKWVTLNGLTEVQLALEPRDHVLEPAKGDWLELGDDRRTLNGLAPQLLQVQEYRSSASPPVVILIGAPDSPFDAETMHPFLRRWDHHTDGSSGSGGTIAVEEGKWISLEDGVEIQYEPGASYSSGDWWTIPARTVSTDSQGGDVLWPHDGIEPRFQPRQGVLHRYCPLGILTVKADKSWAIEDCRTKFPSLTEITAEDVAYEAACQSIEVHTVKDALDTLCGAVSGGCSVTIRPGKDWLSVLNRALVGNPDICFCLQPGEYPVDEPAIIRGQGHLRISGSGPGTLISTAAETALAFDGWASVTVESMQLRSAALRRSPCPLEHTDRHGHPRRSRFNGALMSHNCDRVDIRDVTVYGSALPFVSSACISVWNSDPHEGSESTQSVRISNCELHPGTGQKGILVTNAGRTHIDDNIIAGIDVTVPIYWPYLFQDNARRSLVRRKLLYGATPIDLVPDRKRIARVKSKDQEVFIDTDPNLASAWQTLLSKETQQVRASITSADELRNYLKQRVVSVVQALFKQDRADPVMGIQAFVDWFQSIRKDTEIWARWTDPATRDEALAEVGRRMLRRVLTEKPRQPDATRTATVTYAGFIVRVETDSALTTELQSLVELKAPTGIRSERDLTAYLARTIDTTLRDGPVDPTMKTLHDLLDSWYASFRTLGGQGIVLAGMSQRDVRVVNNTVSHVSEGIHVGLSHEEAMRSDRHSGHRVLLSSNTVSIPMWKGTPDGLGIFVGNVGSLVIADNYIEFERSSGVNSHPDGIRVHGVLGPYLDLAWRNDIRGATNEIVVVPTEP